MSEQDALTARLLFDREVSAETLTEWTAQTAAPKPAREAARTVALLVRAGGEWIGLPASVVEAALPAGPIHAVPHFSNRVFLGLANVDGELLPCMSLAALADAESAAVPAKKPRLIAVNLAEGRFALLADETACTCGYDPASLTPPPETVARSPHHIVTAMAVIEGRNAGIVDERSLGQAILRSLRP